MAARRSDRSDSGYVSQSPPPKPEDEPDLPDLPPEQRQKYYKQYFSKRVEPLVHIKKPDECSTYPELGEEITDAYLDYTTFSVQVWVNYDAAARKFHADARIKDCGQPIIKPSEAQHLEGVDPDGVVQIKRVLLELGTPFTTLARVRILAKSRKDDGITDLTAKVTAGRPDHKLLGDFVRNQCTEFNEYGVGLAEGQHGLLIADIHDIAKRFYRIPSQTEMGRLSRSRNNSTWMDFHDDDDENEGWVDLRELDKGCSTTCDSCDPRKFSASTWFWGSRY